MVHTVSKLIIITLFVITYGISAEKTDTLVITYPGPESSLDTRFTPLIKMVKEALEETTKAFGPYRLEPSSYFINEWRAVSELQTGSGVIDITMRPTSKELEQRLTPVRYPLEKGLIGYRLFFIHQDDKDRFKHITTLDQLKAYSIGQGKVWTDVPIYTHNGFTVETGSSGEGVGYEGLFTKLLLKRYDIFPRSVLEIYQEFNDRTNTYPNLYIEDTILLHYPFARYVWVSNTPKGELIKQRLTVGFEMMLDNGMYDKIFMKNNQATLERAQLKKRTLIEMENPFFPESAPMHRPELWYTP
ncbi:MAG: hypothetical protein OCD01_17615 [Fibrobacterales bacterium]